MIKGYDQTEMYLNNTLMNVKLSMSLCVKWAVRVQQMFLRTLKSEAQLYLPLYSLFRSIAEVSLCLLSDIVL